MTALGTSRWGFTWAERHVEFLEARGVSKEIANERPYLRVEDKAQLIRAGFNQAQADRIPGLLIPLRNVFGADAGYQYRPDVPRTIKDKPVKYETRAGQQMLIDVPRRVQPQLGDPNVPLWITEGPVKADSAVTAGLCCIALLGVWNWRGTNKHGGKMLLPDLDAIAFNGRRVVIAFDSDSFTKVSVYDAAARFAEVLTGLGANVEFLHLPDEGPDKIGLDDYLAQHGPDGLETLVKPELGPRPTPPVKEPVGADGFHLTDLGNAQRLIARHGESVRYVPRWGQWLAWDGARFQTDHNNVRVLDMASTVPAGLWDHVPGLSGSERDTHIRFAKKTESAAALRAIVDVARTNPTIRADHEDLDSRLWQLNCPNGVVNLRSGELLEHDPDYLHTKVTNARYEHAAQAPTWQAFLDEVLPDKDVQRYVQRLAGYSATGDVSEQIMVIATGVGRNGKSTLIGAITHALGDYAVTAPKDLMLQARHEPHPTSMTTLFRARFAAAIETEKGVKLAEAQVKQLTGGDLITARRMREDFWEFEPSHKLWLGCNHLPRIDGTDLAIWRRLRVIPFDVIIPEQDVDRQLMDKLKAEADGILRWIIQGCLDWQTHGLETPEVVHEATKSYQNESNWFTRWLTDRSWKLVDDKHLKTVAVTLRTDFEGWARDEGLRVSQKEFTDALKAAGCTSERSKQARSWGGIVKDD